jgi:hypothetical protein
MIGKTVLERRRDDSEKETLGGKDCGGVTASGSRREGGGYLPEGRDQRGDLLRVKKWCAGLGINELRELRQLRDEIGRLKRLVADLSMDRQILQEIVSKKL